jgi:hypothetical protein
VSIDPHSVNIALRRFVGIELQELLKSRVLDLIVLLVEEGGRVIDLECCI